MSDSPIRQEVLDLRQQLTTSQARVEALERALDKIKRVAIRGYGLMYDEIYDLTEQALTPPAKDDGT